MGITDASNELRGLAALIGRAHVAGSAPRAILLTGSAAEGVSDRHSDIDLIVYHDRRPGLDVLAAVRQTLGPGTARVSAPDVAESLIVEEFALSGVECQIAHCLVATWEREMATVVIDHVPGTTIEKAIMGLANGTAIHGHDLIAQWQSRSQCTRRDWPGRRSLTTYDSFRSGWRLNAGTDATPGSFSIRCSPRRV